MPSELIPETNIAGKICTITVDLDAIAVLTVPPQEVENDVIPGFYNCILDGLEAFFQNSNTGIFTLADYSFGVALQDNYYWFTDSHARGPAGFVKTDRTFGFHTKGKDEMVDR